MRALGVLGVIGSNALLFGCSQQLVAGNAVDGAAFGTAVAASELVVLVGAPGEKLAQGAVYLNVVGAGVAPFEPSPLVPSSALSNGARFGAAIAISGSLAVVGAPGILAAYIFQQQPDGSWPEVSVLTSTDTGFGSSVAVDGTTVVVGAPGAAIGRLSPGKATVFRPSGGGFAKFAVLTSGAALLTQGCGSAVAVIGNRAFLGCPVGGSLLGPSAGSVYEFDLSTPAATRATLPVSSLASGDGFGSALAAANVNGEDVLLVGAPGSDLGASDAGAAYAFLSATGGPFAQAPVVLQEASPATGGRFATTLAINKTGRIAIGAPGAQSGVGSTSVFQVSGTSVPFVAGVSALDAVAGDQQATTVAVSTDSVLVGAPHTSIAPHAGAGAVHLFRDSDWAEGMRMAASFRLPNDEFGSSAAVAGDNAAFTSKTKVDVLRRNAGGWSLAQQITPPVDQVPGSVAANGNRLAIYYRPDLTSAPAIGVIEIYLKSGGSYALEQTMTLDLTGTTETEALKGLQLSMSPDRLVAATGRFNGGDGRVVVYQRSGSSWTLTHDLTSPQAAVTFDLNFGRAAAIDGDLLAVSEVPSSNSAMPGLSLEGKVMLFDLTSSSTTAADTLRAPMPNVDDDFGRAIALNSAFLAVRSECRPSSCPNSVRLYPRTAGTLGVSHTPASETTFAVLPESLALEGNELVAGFPSEAPGGTFDGGAIRLFTVAATGGLNLSSTFNGSVADEKLGSAVWIGNGHVIAATRKPPSSLGFAVAFN